MNETNEQTSHVEVGEETKTKVKGLDSGIGLNSNQTSLEEPIFKWQVIEYDFPDEKYLPTTDRRESHKKFVHPFGTNDNIIQSLLNGPNETYCKAEKLGAKNLLFWIFLTLFMVAVSGVIIFGAETYDIIAVIKKNNTAKP